MGVTLDFKLQTYYLKKRRFSCREDLERSAFGIRHTRVVYHKSLRITSKCPSNFFVSKVQRQKSKEYIKYI